MTVDLGSGDGRFVLAQAAAFQERLVLGVEASRDAMRDASRRASRPAARGGLPNARFVLCAVEAVPAGLAGIADLVTVHFPWGSLRAAASGSDPTTTAQIARLVRRGGGLRLLLADGPRDGIPAITPDTVAATYARLGLTVVECRPATLDDATAAHSSWGKRLLRNPAPGRAAWFFVLHRPRPVPGGGDRIRP